MDVTPENVAAALQAAASRDYQQAQAATDQLDHWHKQHGFHSTLQDLYLARNIPAELRLVALTQLKNGVEKHWKRGANHKLSVDEQALIRSRLLQDLFENASDSRLASFQAIVTAKIARNDFPEAWPSLFDDLVSLLNSPQCNDPTRQALVLTIIRHVIKEFASLRMMKPRKAFYEAAPPLMNLLVSQCAQLLQRFVQDPTQNAQQAIQAVNYLKCIRRLAIIGYESPHKDPTVCELWLTSLHTLRGTLDFILSHRLVAPHSDTFPLLLSQLMKLHLTMSSVHPLSFAFMDGTPDLVKLYWNSACIMQELYFGTRPEVEGISSTDKYFEDRSLFLSFEHKALTLMRSSFKLISQAIPSIKYRATEEERQEPDRAKGIIRARLYSDDFTQTLFQKLISNFLIFDSASLQQWEDEPEEWEANQSEEDDAFDVSPRPCAERLLMDLSLVSSSMAQRTLVQLVAESQSKPASTKDSIYDAFGATAPMLASSGGVDINDFLPQLQADLHNQDPAYTVVRYRIAILLSKWVPIGVKAELKGSVYAMYRDLLGDSDLVVRITAAKSFKPVCDEIGFMPESFAPDAGLMFSRVVELFNHVSLPETVLSLLDTLGAMIERMESKILPFANELIELLGPLWQKLEKEQQMKKAVVRILTKFVQALGSESAPLQPLVLPMIRSALEPGSTTQLYLLEDALELLYHLVQQSKSSSTDLVGVANMLLPLLEMETALCKMTLQVLDALLLLDPAAILQDSVRKPLFQGLTPLLQVRSNEIVSMAIAVVEHLVQHAYYLSQQDGIKAVSEDLMASGILPKMLSSLNACYAAHQTTGPNRTTPPSDARNETYYFTIIARLICFDLHVFLGALQTFATSCIIDTHTTLEHVLDEWFSHLDNVSEPSRRKLMVMALTSLLQTKDRVILVRLQQLITAWTSLLLELRDPPEDSLSDCLLIKEADRQLWDDSPHETRQARMGWADAVRTRALPEYVRTALLETVNDAGGQAAFEQEWLVNVDKEVLNEFQALGIF